MTLTITMFVLPIQKYNLLERIGIIIFWSKINLAELKKRT